MRPFPLYFNELSLTSQNLHSAERLDVVLRFINTLKEAKRKRPDIELHNSLSLYECDMGAGDYLHIILGGNNYIDHWRFIKSLVQKAPWDVSNLTVNVILNAQQPIGLTLALENCSAAISLPSAQAWKNSGISIIVAGNEESVPNLSAPEHVNYWSNLFRDFGVDASASSIVFQGDFLVRMYQRDHNPPHVHVECSGYKATIDIRRFDILGGRLPSHVSSGVIDWIKQNQLELQQGWERCRAGAYPIPIGN